MKKILIFLILAYQKTLSPDKGFLTSSRTACRFLPTCSDYFLEALQKKPLVPACRLGISRILRCHPFGRHGYDPVPLPESHKK